MDIKSVHTKFRQVFPVGIRPKKLNMICEVTPASGNKIECEGVYPVQFEIEIDKKKLHTTLKQKYMDLFLKHHEVVSDNKYDLGK